VACRADLRYNEPCGDLDISYTREYEMLGKRNPQHSLFEPSYWPHRVPEESFYGRLGSVQEVLFEDEEFADMYADGEGRPSLPPSLMSAVLLLQFHDNVSDEEAVQRTLYDLRWKVALHIPLDYEGFDSSSLCRFRDRLLDHGKERYVFDHFVEVAREAGLLPREADQLVDSTPIEGAGAVQDTYTLLRNGIRKLLEAMGYKAKKRRKNLSQRLARYLNRDYKGDIDWSDPDERSEQLKVLVEDTRSAVELAEGSQDEDVQLIAFLLTKIMGDDLETCEEGKPKIHQGVAKDRVISITDPEMRHGRKSASQRFDGYKLQMAEAGENELVTNVDVTSANEHDGEGAPSLIEEQEEAHGTKPKRITGDTSYGMADNRARWEEQGIEVISPVNVPSRKGLFSKADFDIHLEKDQVTCPAGQTTDNYSCAKDHKGRKVKRFHFPRSTCQACPLRRQCTRAKTSGRSITLNYHEELIQKALAFQETEAFHRLYRRRAIVERKIAELVRHGMRKSRYVGKRKTRLQALWTAAMVNLKRLFKLMAERWKEFKALLRRLSAQRARKRPNPVLP